MKTPGVSSNQRFFRKGPAMMIIAVLLVFFFVGVATASSGGEHGTSGEQGTKGWVATDTYRVMNFTVLFVALFILLRKPVSQALDGRIKGIREQLDDLEARKKDAEKQLSVYNEKFALLEQEAENLIQEYVRQGNDAKVRILQEAEAAAEKLEEQARRNIEQEFKKAKLQLQAEILEKTLVKAEELISNKITDKDQDKLVDEYLEKVVA